MRSVGLVEHVRAGRMLRQTISGNVVVLSINLAGARSEGRFCRFRGNTEAFYRNMVYHRHPRPGIYNAVLRSDRFGTGTASVYKMRLRADPYRSQITTGNDNPTRYRIQSGSASPLGTSRRDICVLKSSLNPTSQEILVDRPAPPGSFAAPRRSCSGGGA